MPEEREHREQEEQEEEPQQSGGSANDGFDAEREYRFESEDHPRET